MPHVWPQTDARRCRRHSLTGLVTCVVAAGLPLAAKAADPDPDTIQVVGHPDPEGLLPPQTAPKAVSAIGSAFIEKQAPTLNAYQLVNLLPGANVSSSDPYGLSATSSLTLRGLGQDEIGVLMEGAPQNDIGFYDAYPAQFADAEGAILASAVKVYGEAVRVVRARFATGIDLGRVEAQLADAQAQLADIRGTRAVAEHAIAVLVGVQPAELSIPIDVPPLHPLPIVAGVPADVLQARADIAAAERRVYAANRAIGVARAAWFPAITLGAAGGRQATTLSGLAAAPNLFWSLGPQMVLPLFDGGARHARVQEARAQWREATAHYRATVLSAMAEVEDNLAQGRQLAGEVSATDRAASAEASAARLVYDRYIKGVASILEVVTAQGNELDLRRRAEHARTRLLQTGITLREALGDPAAIRDN